MMTMCDIILQEAHPNTGARCSPTQGGHQSKYVSTTYYVSRIYVSSWAYEQGRTTYKRKEKDEIMQCPCPGDFLLVCQPSACQPSWKIPPHGQTAQRQIARAASVKCSWPDPWMQVLE